LGALALLLALASGPVEAQHQAMLISREQSPLQVRLPDLLYGRELFFHFDHAATGYDSYYAALTPNGSAYPRIQAYYDVANGTHAYARKSELTEAWVRHLTAFFNEKVIELAPSERIAAPDRATIARFTVDRSDCFAFAFFADDKGPKPLDHSQRQVRGYYCSEEGGRLDDETIGRVLDGIQTRP